MEYITKGASAIDRVRPAISSMAVSAAELASRQAQDAPQAPQPRRQAMGAARCSTGHLAIVGGVMGCESVNRFRWPLLPCFRPSQRHPARSDLGQQLRSIVPRRTNATIDRSHTQQPVWRRTQQRCAVALSLPNPTCMSASRAKAPSPRASPDSIAHSAAVHDPAEIARLRFACSGPRPRPRHLYRNPDLAGVTGWRELTMPGDSQLGAWAAGELLAGNPAEQLGRGPVSRQSPGSTGPSPATGG
jgi:hypothetical protein